MGISPDTPIAFRTTMIIGAIARIGMVWEAMIQGITDMCMARECTIPTASASPSVVPKAKPRSVAERVTQP